MLRGIVARGGAAARGDGATGPGPRLRLEPGARWSFPLKLRAPHGLANPGGADAGRHALAQRIALADLATLAGSGAQGNRHQALTRLEAAGQLALVAATGFEYDLVRVEAADRGPPAEAVRKPSTRRN